MAIVCNGDTRRDRDVVRWENEMVGMGNSPGPQHPLVYGDVTHVVVHKLLQHAEMAKE